MLKNPIHVSAACYTAWPLKLTVLERSFEDCLSRFGAVLLLLVVAADGAEAPGSVVRLHCTPCLAQLVHGLSSSHCRIVSFRASTVR
jgi:hypothetical protein